MAGRDRTSYLAAAVADRLRADGLLEEVDRAVDPVAESGPVAAAIDERFGSATLFSDLGHGWAGLAHGLAGRVRIAQALTIEAGSVLSELSDRIDADQSGPAIAIDPDAAAFGTFDPGSSQPLLSALATGACVAVLACEAPDGPGRAVLASVSVSEDGSWTLKALGPRRLMPAASGQPAALIFGGGADVIIAAALAAVSGRSTRLSGDGPDGRDLAEVADVVVAGRLVSQGAALGFEPDRLYCRPAPTLYLIDGAPAGREWRELEALAIEVELFHHIRSVEGGIDVLDVRSYPETENLLAAVKLRPKIGGQSKTAMLAALSSPVLQPRIVIGVDEDIELGDLREIAWSFASRTHAEHDIQTVSGSAFAGSRGGEIREARKWFVDSTKSPLTQPEARASFDRARPKNMDTVRLSDFLRLND